LVPRKKDHRVVDLPVADLRVEKVDLLGVADLLVAVARLVAAVDLLVSVDRCGSFRK
jgi:hypothetical protein